MSTHRCDREAAKYLPRLPCPPDEAQRRWMWAGHGPLRKTSAGLAWVSTDVLADDRLEVLLQRLPHARRGEVGSSCAPGVPPQGMPCS
jgi:hypothetical protein